MPDCHLRCTDNARKYNPDDLGSRVYGGSRLVQDRQGVGCAGRCIRVTVPLNVAPVASAESLLLALNFTGIGESIALSINHFGIKVRSNGGDSI